MIELVIFDLDGVLVDACEWHRIALNEALKEVGGYEIPLEDHYEIFNGIPTKEKLDILVKQNIIKERDRKTIYEKKQSKTTETINQYCKINKEKIEMIMSLKEKGVRVACYTNSIRETATLMLEKTGVLHLFDLFLSSQDVEVPKPSPMGYVQIMKHFGVKEENTLIIEDSPKGFEAAYKSGAKVFRVINQDHVNAKLFKEFLL